jgi:hypothetical protein
VPNESGIQTKPLERSPYDTDAPVWSGTEIKPDCIVIIDELKVSTKFVVNPTRKVKMTPARGKSDWLKDLSPPQSKTVVYRGAPKCRGGGYRQQPRLLPFTGDQPHGIAVSVIERIDNLSGSDQ